MDVSRFTLTFPNAQASKEGFLDKVSFIMYM